MFKTEHGGPCGLLTKQQIKRVWGTLQPATGSGDCVLGTDPAAGRASETNALHSALHAAPGVDAE